MRISVSDALFHVIRPGSAVPGPPLRPNLNMTRSPPKVGGGAAGLIEAASKVGPSAAFAEAHARAPHTRAMGTAVEYG